MSITRIEREKSGWSPALG